MSVESRQVSPLCPHCGGTTPCQRHCANEQCNWFTCVSCRKVITMKIEEQET